MHQRSCKTIEGLAKQLTADLCEELANHDPAQNEIIDYGNLEPPLIKTGVKLPETNQDCSTANTFFQVHLDRLKIDDEDIDECVQDMNDLAYKLFQR